MNRVLAWLPWCVLLAGFYLMSTVYPQLPDRWAIHYDVHNQPNGWTTKSYPAVFFPLLMGCGVCALLEVVGQFARVANSMLSQAGAERMNDMNRHCLRLVSAAIAAFLTYLAWKLPTATSPGFLVGPVVGLLAVVIGGPGVCLYHTMKGLRRGGDLPKGYHLLYYSDPDDPRIWVPKIAGVGWTLNFAHSVAWLWMFLILVLPVGGLVLALSLAH